MIQLIFFGPQHIEQTFEWVSQADLQHAFLMRGAVTRSGNQAYFAALLADPRQRAFAVLEDTQHIGNCGLKHIDVAAGEGEMWMYLGDPALRARGIGTQVLRLLLLRSGALGLRRVVAHVSQDNVRAQALYRRFGFADQGPGGGEWAGRGAGVVRMLWSAS
jgi:RimJ/RimL family protein N-acetyltransferase